MKGLIFDIKRYAIHDGPGIRTTVFFKGCPMQCLWCHNPESQAPEPEIMIRERILDGEKHIEQDMVGKYYSVDEVMDEISKDKVFYEQSGGGATFSGGEPLMQAGFLKELLMACRDQGIHTALDTCGHANDNALDMVLDLADLFLYDLKLIDPAMHLKYTGVSNQLSLENLDKVIEAGKELVIRFPVIPGITDPAENIDEMVNYLKTRNIERIDLLPYHDIAKRKYKRLGRKYLLEDTRPVSEDNTFDLLNHLINSGFQVKING